MQLETVGRISAGPQINFIYKGYDQELNTHVYEKPCRTQDFRKKTQLG